MNTPARFESLLWMASPMAAWAQASNEAPPKAVAAKRGPATGGQHAKPRRKRGKATV